MDFEPYRTKLTTEQGRLLEELRAIGKPDQDNPANWQAVAENGDAQFRDEVADRLENFNERAAATTILERRLQAVTKALERIAAGTYGVCEVSGEPIEPDRLEANPAARTCKSHRDQDEDSLP